MNSFNPELQFKDTECANKSKLIELLSQLRGFRFVKTLVLVCKKIKSKDKTKYDNFYSSYSKIIINESDIENAFNYNKHTKVFSKRFRMDYWFSHWSYN